MPALAVQSDPELVTGRVRLWAMVPVLQLDLVWVPVSELPSAMEQEPLMAIHSVPGSVHLSVMALAHH